MADDIFDRVYSTSDPGELRDLYDEWANDYDADLAQQKYATPDRMAEAIARHLEGHGPVLDFACGTGMSGRSLAANDISPVDGYDVSAGMLDVARRTGVYRNLIQGEPESPIAAPLGDYIAVTACGAISPGAAPAALIDEIIEGLATDALFAVSLNEHALQEPDFIGRIDAAVDDGRVDRLEADNGPHLPDLGLTSTVVVVRRR